MKRMKTKLKIDNAYYYAPYVPIFRGSERKLQHLWKQILKDARRREIFEEVED